MAHLSITGFGSLELQLDGILLSGFRSQKVRALLAYLLLEPDRIHERAHISGLLWPDYSDEQAKTYLRHSIANLRKVIHDKAQNIAFLHITPSTICFNWNSDYWFDVETFEQKASIVGLQSTSFTTEAIHQLQQSIALYRAPLLNGFFLNDCAEFEQWLLFKRESLHYRVINTLYAVAGYYEQRKLYEQAHQYAWRLVELEPALEEAHRQLMRLLALTGQRTAALAQFEKCRTLLQQEMDVEPADETLALFRAIKDGIFATTTDVTGGISLAKPRTAPNNITPQPVPLVGRQQEIEQVSLLLQQTDCRLLTLIGPGGIGKTTLSLQIANAVRSFFPTGFILFRYTQ
ncbi:MAG: BTAD domain-containing putative transcriptional regulator [Caldilineaceae bacterium]